MSRKDGGNLNNTLMTISLWLPIHLTSLFPIQTRKLRCGELVIKHSCKYTHIAMQLELFMHVRMILHVNVQSFFIAINNIPRGEIEVTQTVDREHIFYYYIVATFSLA